jgi:hypothetical protein
MSTQSDIQLQTIKVPGHLCSVSHNGVNYQVLDGEIAVPVEIVEILKELHGVTKFPELSIITAPAPEPAKILAPIKTVMKKLGGKK